MKKTEIILVIIALIGFGLYLIPIEGGTIIVTVSLILLSLMYFIFGFAFLNGIKLKKIFKKESYKGISVLSIILAIVMGMTLSTAVIGVLFGLLSWLGAGIMLVIGLLNLAFLGILILVGYLVDKSFSLRGVMGRALILAGLSLLLLILPNRTIINFKERDYPEFLKTPPENPGDKQLDEKEFQKQLKKARVMKKEKQKPSSPE